MGDISATINFMETNMQIKTWWLPSSIPSGDRLLPSISRQTPLMVRFPLLFSEDWREDLIGWFREELPEHFEVSSAGSSSLFHQIMISQLISEDEVMAEADALVHAARRFAVDANRLAYSVADANGIDPAELPARMFQLEHVPEEWELFPHGAHLCGTHLETGQEIEISMDSGGFAMLDAEFFCRYLETTPGLELPPTFIDPASDMQRAFDILEKNGKFRGG